MTTMAVPLYQRTEALLQVRMWIDEHEEEVIEAGGDLDALPELRDLLLQAEGDFTAKVEAVAAYVKELGVGAAGQMATAQAIEQVAQGHRRRAKAQETLAAKLKAYVLGELDRVNYARVEGRELKVRRQLSVPAVESSLEDADLERLHAAGCQFTVAETTYRMPADVLKEAYKAAVETVKAAWGERPKPGSEHYAERLAEWHEHMHAAMRKDGVPEGVTVVQREHIRIV